MDDDQLERFGDYFVYHNVHVRYGITFERFVYMNKIGTWEAWLT